MSRDRVAGEARLQAEQLAHYIKVGCGHKFNALGELEAGVIRAGMVRPLWGTHRPRLPGVPNYVRFAVTSELGGRRICAGRCGLVAQHSTIVGDPEGDLANPTQHVWRRPENYAQPELSSMAHFMNPDHTVLGECCIGRRHFDCLGFVIWCFQQGDVIAPGPHGFPFFSGQFVRQPLIDRLATPTPTQPPQHPRPGDILFSRMSEDGASADYTHIGIAVSSTEVAHAAGYKWGVQVTPIDNSGERGGHIVWERMYGRPTCFND